MKLSIVSLFVIIMAVTIYVQAMPTYDAPDAIPQTTPEKAQHQLPHKEGKKIIIFIVIKYL